jgi:hypothetical protein
MTPAAARRLFESLDEIGLVQYFNLFQLVDVTLERLSCLDARALKRGEKP